MRQPHPQEGVYISTDRLLQLVMYSDFGQEVVVNNNPILCYLFTFWLTVTYLSTTGLGISYYQALSVCQSLHPNSLTILTSPTGSFLCLAFSKRNRRSALDSGSVGLDGGITYMIGPNLQPFREETAYPSPAAQSRPASYHTTHDLYIVSQRLTHIDIAYPPCPTMWAKIFKTKSLSYTANSFSGHNAPLAF